MTSENKAEQAAGPWQLLDSLRTVLSAVLRETTGAEPGFLAPERPFRELGLDSLGAIEFHRRIGLSTGLSLPVSVVFDHPTLAALTEHLINARRGVQPAAEIRVPRAVIGTEPVAIVGMGCRYPGGIGSPEDLWQVVADERDVTGEFPGDRGWDLD